MFSILYLELQWRNQSKRATWATKATDQQHKCFINLMAGQPGQSKGQPGHCPQLPRCSYATAHLCHKITSTARNSIGNGNGEWKWKIGMGNGNVERKCGTFQLNRTREVPSTLAPISWVRVGSCGLEVFNSPEYVVHG